MANAIWKAFALRRILTREQQAIEHAAALRISRRWRERVNSFRWPRPVRGDIRPEIRELAKLRNGGISTNEAFRRVEQKMYWREAPASMRLYTVLRRARNRLRSAIWRRLRRVPAIDRWAVGRFWCRR